MPIQVFGHKAPDTDTTGSALIWAWYLTEVQGAPATARLLGEPNTEAAFVLERWGFEAPELLEDVAEGDEVAIVDTNNPAELPASLEKATIVEIIDHHLLAGGIKTKGPINITIRPVACTATILHDLMGADAAARMPEGIKGLMLSCILSARRRPPAPTAALPRASPPISVSRSTPMPRRCSPRSPTSRGSPTASFSGWARRNTRSTE